MTMMQPEQRAKPLSYQTERGEVTLTISTVKARFCPKATDWEVYEFIQFCRYHGLNPWLREAYLVKYSDNDPASIIVAYEQFIRRAKANPAYDGYESGLIVERDGLIERTTGAFTAPGDKLLGGWAKVHMRGVSHPVEVALNLEQMMQTRRDGTPNRTWSRMPNLMAEKVPIALAHRRALSEVQAMYLEGETMADIETDLDGPLVTDTNALDADSAWDALAPAEEMIDNGTTIAPSRPAPRPKQQTLEASPQNEQDAPWCPTHGVQYRLQQKGTRSWWSHPIEGGGWCNPPK